MHASVGKVKAIREKIHDYFLMIINYENKEKL